MTEQTAKVVEVRRAGVNLYHENEAGEKVEPAGYVEPAVLPQYVTMDDLVVEHIGDMTGGTGEILHKIRISEKSPRNPARGSLQGMATLSGNMVESLSPVRISPDYAAAFERMVLRAFNWRIDYEESQKATA